MAMKNGIERTKNTVASSSEANNTYTAKTTAKYGTTARGKMPVTIKPNKTSWTTKIILKVLDLIDMALNLMYHLLKF